LFGQQIAAKRFGRIIIRRYVFAPYAAAAYLVFTVRKQNRVTDHRLGKGNMVSCEAIMEGDGLGMLIDELKDRHFKEALQEVLETG
jgi:hypothetical protein